MHARVLGSQMGELRSETVSLVRRLGQVVPQLACLHLQTPQGVVVSNRLSESGKHPADLCGARRPLGAEQVAETVDRLGTHPEHSQTMAVVEREVGIVVLDTAP